MAAFYREAALILKRLEKKKGSLKSLVFSTRMKNPCISYQKKLFALTSQTLKYKRVIEEVMTTCNHFLKMKSDLSHHLCMILLYDLLLGKGIQCGGPIKRFLFQHKMELLVAFRKITEKISIFDESTVKLPRYARVNSLKTDMCQVEEELANCGYELVSQKYFNSQHLLPFGGSCTCSSFCKDEHIPELLAFCPCAPLTGTRLYASGHIIIQDKASCFPAFLLAPPPGSHAIDACAAPGNKSTHLACLMKNNGIIYAFDKDRFRYETLLKMIKKSGASCIVPKLQDFLKTDTSSFGDIKYILVDPSCSGSGISNRIEYSSQSVDPKRLQSLANFQFKILAHALSFPNVEKVVYSTCSVHKEVLIERLKAKLVLPLQVIQEEPFIVSSVSTTEKDVTSYYENELVVDKALKKFSMSFQLEYAIPDWKHRGHTVFPTGDHCIRADAKDLTNGFFIAVFERLIGTESDVQNCTTTDVVQSLDVHVHKLDKAKTKLNHKKRKHKHSPVTSSR